MATENIGKCASFPAGADLSAKQYYAVKLNSSGQVVLAGDGEEAIGSLQNKPESGQVAEVALFGAGGLIKCVVGADVAAGVVLGVAAGGLLVTGTTGEFTVGVMLSTGTKTSGDVVTIVAQTGRVHA